MNVTRRPWSGSSPIDAMVSYREDPIPIRWRSRERPNQGEIDVDGLTFRGLYGMAVKGVKVEREPSINPRDVDFEREHPEMVLYQVELLMKLPNVIAPGWLEITFTGSFRPDPYQLDRGIKPKHSVIIQAVQAAANHELEESIVIDEVPVLDPDKLHVPKTP